ncbi:hypothetical protein ABPG75_000377 [Micractinium tetrahymenae]
MLRRAGSPVGRKRGFTPVIWIALISVSGVLVLTGAHLALGSRSSGAGGGGGREGSGGRGGEGSERVPRVLLQGSGIGGSGAGLQQQQLSLRPDVEPQPVGLRRSGGSGGDAAAAAVDSAAEEEAAAPEAEPPVEQLGPDSDLATFAAKGTQCVVTPAHGKIALLFLTHGDLPHDMVWTAWMREARGLLPRSSLAGEQAFCLQQCDDAGDACMQQCGRAAACNPLCLEALRQQQGSSRSTAVLQQQHLFSVYVHARPTLKDYKEPSVFAGRLIPDRAIAKPGTHAIAAAAKKLVEVAVLDQRNEWFVLVGDTTVPLYHPAMVWQQLMHEGRSRLDVCVHKDTYLARKRSTPAMRTDRFRPDRHWRRSSQWFALNRKHAELFAHDQEVAHIFSKHCYVGYDEQEGRQRDCASAEHYLPSLLAMYGLDNETTCDSSGGTAWAWQPSVGGAKDSSTPQTFQPGHVTAELFAGLRSTIRRAPDEQHSAEGDAQLCAGWSAAAQAAQEAFIDTAAIEPDSCAATLGSTDFLLEDPYEGVVLNERCPLLARKFSPHAAKWVHKVYRSCTAGLGVLPCSQRLTDRDNNWWSR